MQRQRYDQQGGVELDSTTPPHYYGGWWQQNPSSSQGQRRGGGRQQQQQSSAYFFPFGGPGGGPGAFFTFGNGMASSSSSSRTRASSSSQHPGSNDLDLETLLRQMMMEDEMQHSLEALLRQMMMEEERQSSTHTSKRSTWGSGGRSSSASSFSTGNNEPSNIYYERTILCTLEELAMGTTKKLRVIFDHGDNREQTTQIFSVDIQKGWREGTKIRYPAKRGCPGIVFVVKEKKHPYFQRCGNDLVYRHSLNHHSSTSNQYTDGSSSSSSSSSPPVHLNITLLDGTIWSRTLPGDSSLARPGQHLTIPNLGMPIKGGPEKGNLIIEFH